MFNFGFAAVIGVGDAGLRVHAGGFDWTQKKAGAVETDKPRLKKATTKTGIVLSRERMIASLKRVYGDRLDAVKTSNGTVQESTVPKFVVAIVPGPPS